jgi:hypothetical protein
MKYLRDDIYLCVCCYQFFKVKTHEKVNVPYTEMPAELAMELMIKRAVFANSKTNRQGHERSKKRLKKSC